MKTLPLTLRKNGFEYTQLLRGQRSCLYEQRVAPELVAYEVFLIKIKPERIIQGKVIEAKETFPHDEGFGRWAWSFGNYEKALWRFLELEKGLTREEFTYPDTNKKIYG